MDSSRFAERCVVFVLCCLQCDTPVKFVAAWSTVTFDIHVAADMPGTFEDSLLLLYNGSGSGKLVTTPLPLTVTVSGSSLELDETVVGVQLSGPTPQLIFGEVRLACLAVCV